MRADMAPNEIVAEEQEWADRDVAAARAHMEDILREMETHWTKAVTYFMYGGSPHEFQNLFIGPFAGRMIELASAINRLERAMQVGELVARIGRKLTVTELL